MRPPQLRMNTYKGEEIMVVYHQWFLWERNDDGDGYVGQGEVIISGVSIWGHELDLFHIPQALVREIKQMASECAGEWEE